MLDGMKMAAQGMMTMSAKQDIITNNLANVGTAGYRKESIAITSFTEILDREVGADGMNQSSYEIHGAPGMETHGSLASSSVTHSSQGSLKETGNPFDMALDDNGRGFFTIQSPDGIKFTRAGSFRLSTSGYLVTTDGSFVLGHRGPMKLSGSNFQVSNDGVVSCDGKPVDRLLVTVFDDSRQLKRAGDSNFVAQGGVRATTDFQLKQGYVEQANVNAINEMVDMMMVMRNYEANQKVLQAHDQRLQKTVNELGRVR